MGKHFIKNSACERVILSHLVKEIVISLYDHISDKFLLIKYSLGLDKALELSTNAIINGRHWRAAGYNFLI